MSSFMEKGEVDGRKAKHHEHISEITIRDVEEKHSELESIKRLVSNQME